MLQKHQHLDHHLHLAPLYEEEVEAVVVVKEGVGIVGGGSLLTGGVAGLHLPQLVPGEVFHRLRRAV